MGRLGTDHAATLRSVNITRGGITTVLRTDTLDYHLPESLVATSPAARRDSARLMVVRRTGNDPPEHTTIHDLPSLLEPDDLLVRNTTRVIPARLLGRREDTQGQVEALYLEQGPEPSTWVAMIKARRVREGAPVRIDAADGPSALHLELLRRVDDTPGAWVVSVELDGDPIDDRRTLKILAALGHTPLPPYIRAARKASGLAEESPDDPERYQTVYAHEPGSVAAPTAGLHLTDDLLGRLADRGVRTTDVILHVGSGTFKPVETDTVEAHEMHAEWCTMSGGALADVRRTRAGGGRVIAIGTTSARTLESYAPLAFAPDSMQTRLLITPGHAWQWTDGLLTNFHLPRSTLMAMVAALLDGGVDRLKSLYAEAIERDYRFYSYGDAMLILP